MSGMVIVMLVALTFYLVDSVLLLRDDEALLSSTNLGWRVHLPIDELRILGRRVFVPNPFMPHRVLFKVRWEMKEASLADSLSTESKETIQNLIEQAPFLQGLALLELLILIGVLTYSVFYPAVNWIHLAFLSELYVLTLAALAWVLVRRNQFGVKTSQFFGLAADALICVPHSINLLRKLALLVNVKTDLVAVGKSVMSAKEYKRLVSELTARVNQEIEYSEVDGLQYRELIAYREAILSESK